MRILAIDDEPEALKQIQKAVASAAGPDGKPFEVVGVTDHQEALRRIEAEYFDIVVVDMVLGPDHEEGLAVLRQLTDKSPITIVLTAYPSVPNCVASLRAGAWDYLEKQPDDGSDPYENLLKSMNAACEYRLAHPEAGRTNPDSIWVRDNLGVLLKDYAGKIVAVIDRKVVGSGETYGELADRVKQEHPVARATFVSLPDTTAETVE
jgi:DNA-binding NtrC family response regulator